MPPAFKGVGASFIGVWTHTRQPKNRTGSSDAPWIDLGHEASHRNATWRMSYGDWLFACPAKRARNLPSSARHG